MKIKRTEKQLKRSDNRYNQIYETRDFFEKSENMKSNIGTVLFLHAAALLRGRSRRKERRRIL